MFLSRSRFSREKLRKGRNDSKRERLALQDESNPGIGDSMDLSSALELYCAEIRRLNDMKPEDDHRLQVTMSEVWDRLVDTISKFPGSARFFLDGWQKDPFSSLAALAGRCEDEFEPRDLSISEPRSDEVALMDEASELDDPVSCANPMNSDTDLSVIQSLSACLDDLHLASRQHGIEGPQTHQRRAALSEVFRKLPLTPRLVEAQVARFDSILAGSHWVCDRNSAQQNDPVKRYTQKHFEQLYAIGWNEFEPIARKASQLYGEWQKVRNRIVEFHVGLVIFLARQYSSDPQELVDFIQEGNIGLIKAVERFDYRLGFRFSTYATYWIRLAISRHLARCGRTVRIPYRQNLQFGTIRKKRECFTQIHGRAPTTLELSSDTGISTAGLRKLEGLSQTVASLDAPLEAGESLDLMSML
ncbi:MAG: sigma-70 family RNA polymerase sigma factor, partial [Methylococcales bacterium]